MPDAPLTIQQLHADPRALAESVELPGLGRAELRPLLPADAALLGDYFEAFSAETRRRFGPHRLDRETAGELAALAGQDGALRTVAVRAEGPGPRILGYFILLLTVRPGEASRFERLGVTLDPARDCTLAPSVADDCQAAGLGGRMLRHLLGLARRLGRERMVLLGGTQAGNERAVHFYRKHGFTTVGSFEHPPGAVNFDMVLELGSGAPESP